ncbi:MAG: class I SAM-dependent methyltransferase [Parachlamydiaceae bacterium]
MSVTLSPNYLMQTGKADLPRASAMNQIYDASSLNFFPFDKIKDGDKLLFAACGNGVLMVGILKRIKAKNISVTAIDSSIEQLSCARALADSEGFSSINCQQRTINDLSELQGQYHLVHSRFVLNHLENPNDRKISRDFKYHSLYN